MKQLIDSFWRAAAYCLHPKVIALSLLPLAIGVALSLGLGWLYWEQAVAGLRATLEGWQLVDAGLQWVEGVAGPSFRAVLVPLLVVLLAAPVVVLVSVLLVAWLMTPALVNLVADRRFADMDKRQGAGFLASVFWSLGCAVAAAVVMVLSLPLWFIPPLVLVVPPLIWGWLTYKVMAFDALATHADRHERRALLKLHRGPLLGIGVVTGYLGAAPSLIWAASVATVIFAPFIIALSIWLYTLVFAFSSLWFAHYLLAALAALRSQPAAPAGPLSPQPGGAATEVLPRLAPLGTGMATAPAPAAPSTPAPPALPAPGFQPPHLP